MDCKDITIRLEQQKDYMTVENLVREAFWNVYRPGCSEHYVLHTLRNDIDFVKDEDVDAFDTKFPPKEKLKLPDQLF